MGASIFRNSVYSVQWNIDLSFPDVWFYRIHRSISVFSEQIIFYISPHIYRSPIFISLFQDPRLRRWIEVPLYLEFRTLHKVQKPSNYEPIRVFTKVCHLFPYWLTEYMNDWLVDLLAAKLLYIRANKMITVRFKVFTAVTMKNCVFWDITPCGSCKNRCFGGT
jgi:hypothetical protein